MPLPSDERPTGRAEISDSTAPAPILALVPPPPAAPPARAETFPSATYRQVAENAYELGYQDAINAAVAALKARGARVGLVLAIAELRFPDQEAPR